MMMRWLLVSEVYDAAPTDSLNPLQLNHHLMVIASYQPWYPQQACHVNAKNNGLHKLHQQQAVDLTNGCDCTEQRVTRHPVRTEFGTKRNSPRLHQKDFMKTVGDVD